MRTGESARKLASGSDGYGHVVDEAEAASVFNPAMVELTRLIADSAARAHDFSSAKRVADVGGGYGELLVAILAAHPHLHGVLFELPHAIGGARSRIADAGLASRCELVTGSFFEGVPKWCDVYLLKSVLHNWNDERCGVLLSHCRRAMNEEARLLIVERLMPERITGSSSEQTIFCGDLNMLVGLGGRERTQAEFAALLAFSGLAACRCVPIALDFNVIEARISEHL